MPNIAGVLQAMTNGVPMVLAGATEDKLEVAMRAEYAGIAVNLRTETPTSRCSYAKASTKY